MTDIISLSKQKQLDTILNKTVLDLFLYSGLGYVAGFGVGLLFKARYPVKYFVSGIGCSYGFTLNKDSFNHALWYKYK